MKKISDKEFINLIKNKIDIKTIKEAFLENFNIEVYKKNLSFENSKICKIKFLASIFDILTLENTDLENTDFYDNLFLEINVINSNLKKCKFNNSILGSNQSAILDSKFYTCVFENIVVSGSVEFNRTFFKNCSWNNCNFKLEQFLDVSIEENEINNSIFSECYIDGDISQINIKNSLFEESEIYLSECKLSNINNCKFQKNNIDADFKKLHLKDTKFYDSVIKGSFIENSIIYECEFNKIIFNFEKICNCKFLNCNFYDVTWTEIEMDNIVFENCMIQIEAFSKKQLNNIIIK